MFKKAIKLLINDLKTLNRSYKERKKHYFKDKNIINIRILDA